MSPRKLLLVLIALATGAGTLYVARQLLKAPEPVQVAAPAVQGPVEPALRILVAARSLPAGTLVKAEDLKWQSWDKADPRLPSLLTEGAVEPLDYRGAVVRRGIELGAPIVAGRLVKPGEQGFLSVVLDAGMRAVSVPINGVTGLAGLVFPGDRVDLILTHTVVRTQDPNLSERRISETVLTDLRVLAIDQTVDDQTTSPQIGKIATLEVAPKEAELVVLMAELGQLSLSLRSLDTEEPEAETVAEAERLALLEEAPASESAAPQLHGRSPTATPELAVAAALRRLAPLLPRHPAERLAEGGAAAQAYSWDSDVSAVLPGPSDAKDRHRAVRVFRGNVTTDEIFENRQ